MTSARRTRSTLRLGLSVVTVLAVGGVLPLRAADTASAGMAAVASLVCTSSGTTGAPTRATSGTTDGHVDVLDTLAQVRPLVPATGRLAGAAQASLCSARDAYASFQLGISADVGSPLNDVVVSAGDLTGPDGSTIPGSAHDAASDIQLDRETDVRLYSLSDEELSPSTAPDNPDQVTPAASRVPRSSTGRCADGGGACDFPDALLPDRDSLDRAARNAFTNLDISAGHDQAVWADIFVPADTTPGLYVGDLDVSHAAGQDTQVPIDLEVLSPVLPATSSVHTNFSYEPNGDPGNSAGYLQEAELGLDDRISVSPNSGAPVAALSALMNGSDTDVQLTDADGRHASLTDVIESSHYEQTDAQTAASAAGATTRVWAYCDEVVPSSCVDDYTANDAGSGLPVLAIDDPLDGWADPDSADPARTVVPAQLQSTTCGVVDLAQFLDPTGAWLGAAGYTHDAGVDRGSYLHTWQNVANPNCPDGGPRSSWMYLTNESGSDPYNGGDATPVAHFTGYPSFGVDQIASEQVAAGWNLFTDGVGGLLYYLVNRPEAQALSRSSDRTDTGASTGGQDAGLTGDGLLFYPAGIATISPSDLRPVTETGDDLVPLESIRLKRIRDGLQDNELLRLASAVGNASAARDIATGLFPAISDDAVTPAAYDAAEQSLDELVSSGHLVVTTPSLDTARTGVVYSAALTAAGGTAPYTWSLGTGSLPAGLTLNSSGVLSGTPAAAGTSTFTVTVTDSSDPALNASRTLSMSVSDAPLAITTSSLPKAIERTHQSTALRAAGGVVPYRWSMDSGALPKGLSLSASGVLSGAPTRVAPTTFTVTVQDSAVPAARVSRTFHVDPIARGIAAHDLNCDGHADFLGVLADGDLALYDRTAKDWAPGNPLHVGTGYTRGHHLLYQSLVLAGDLNGDGAPDAIGRTANGRLYFRAGDCTGHLAHAVATGVTTSATPIGIGDFNADHHADLLYVDLHGVMWLLPGTGTGHFGHRVQVGAGWHGRQVIALGDLNHNGLPDIAVRDSTNALTRWEGNGHGHWRIRGTKLGPTISLAVFAQLYGPGDITGDGRPDLVALQTRKTSTSPAGRLWRYTGLGTRISTHRERIGDGWTTAVIEIAH